MDSLEIPVGSAAPALTPIIGTQRPPRIWKFWGTALWGLFIFAAMFVGQIAVVAWLVLRRRRAIGPSAPTPVGGAGLPVSLSLSFGLPARIRQRLLPPRASRTAVPDSPAPRQD